MSHPADMLVLIARRPVTLELRVEGRAGELDASQCLRVLAMLADVATAVAPQGAEMPLVDLWADSAVAVIEPTNVTEGHLMERIDEAFHHPSQLTRQLRGELATAFQTRADFGIEGFGYRGDGRSVEFDTRVYNSVKASLSRPSGWTSVTGEVRSVGRSTSGIYGRIRNSVDHHIVNFEAPSSLDDDLRETLFRRAVLSGEAEMDDLGKLKRIIVERVQALGAEVRLSDLDFTDMVIDPVATERALQDLRRG